MARYFFILIFPLLTYGQLRPEIEELFIKLNTKPLLGSQNIGSNGKVNEYYTYYNLLDSLATDSEILYMIRAGKKETQTYLNHCLINRKSTAILTIFEDCLKNDEPVHIQTGCTGYESSKAAELLTGVYGEKTKLLFQNQMSPEDYDELKKYYPNKELISIWKEKEIDSVLTIMYSKSLNYDNTSDQVISRICSLTDYTITDYKRIRFFAQKYPSRNILAALAKHQNTNDLDLLKENFPESLFAISKFPHPNFIALLNSTTVPDEYDEAIAIAAFSGKEASALFESYTAKKFPFLLHNLEPNLFDSELLAHFLSIIEENQSVETEEFLLKMWTNYKYISYSFFDRIKSSQLDKLTSGFILQKKLNFYGSDKNWYSKNELPDNPCAEIKKFLLEHVIDASDLRTIESTSCD